MALAEGQRRAAAFAYHLAVSPFATPQQTYLDKNPDPRYSYVATGAIVFDKSDPNVPRVLLLERSASDSMPGRWEIPGGGCDDEDKTILHAAARELWEETGLKAAHIGPAVGEGFFFTSRSGKQICKFTFIVETEHSEELPPPVKLNPEEHQQYIWATKQEIEGHMSGDIKLDLTTQDLEEAVVASFSMSEAASKDLPSTKENL